MTRALAAGVAFWGLGTLAIRRAGGWPQQLCRTAGRTVGLYLTSFVITAIVVPAACGLLRIERPEWDRAAAALAFPTLFLDAFSCVFFGRLFPRLPESFAGIFGGWMLICCAGGFAGVWLWR